MLPQCWGSVADDVLTLGQHIATAQHSEGCPGHYTQIIRDFDGAGDPYMLF